MLVCLKDFFASGIFGLLPFGCDRQRLEAVAGPPEDVGGVSRKHRRPVIWKYGDVEFYFSRTSGGLEMVHIDRFTGSAAAPQGWGRLQIDPWVVREGMSLTEFVQALEAHQFASAVLPEPGSNVEVVVVDSGVEVRFVANPDRFTDFVGLACLSRRVEVG